MIKGDTETITKNHLHYIVEKGQKTRFKPWLGGFSSVLYDFIMKSVIFPKKIGGDINKHNEILSQELKNIYGRRVLELATGSGSAVNFLPNDNKYTGTDISPGLLSKAVKRFRTAGFKDVELYVTSVHNLPFDNNIFFICLCILSLNFFDPVKKVFQEIKRVLVPGGVFICCVPVPERSSLQSTIRGKLFSEEELSEICNAHGFEFERVPVENGALLYFRATLLK